MRHHGFSCSSLYTVTPEQAQENLLIKAKKLKNGTLRNNVVIGDVDFVQAKSVEGLDVAANRHITPMPPVQRRWYAKLWGQILMGVIASLIAGVILYLSLPA
jgi:hypothetical protein